MNPRLQALATSAERRPSRLRVSHCARVSPAVSPFFLMATPCALTQIEQRRSSLSNALLHASSLSTLHARPRLTVQTNE